MAKVLTELSRVLAGFVDTLGTDRPCIAVIGGLAVSVHLEPRFTRDVDLAVAVGSDTEAERLVLALRQQGYRLLSVLEHDSGRLATARLVPPGGGDDGVLVDLLFASSGIEADIVRGATPIEVLPGLTLPVASIGHLLAMKLLSVDANRPKDAQDLVGLRQAASPTDLQVCREAIARITERGFHRGRDLPLALERLLAG